MTAHIYDKNLQTIGEGAIAIWHNETVIRFPSVYKFTLQQLYTYLESRKAGKAFTEGLGLAITSVPLSNGRVADAMKELSKASMGNIPSAGGFYKALQDESQNFGFDNLKDVSFDIVKDAIEKAATGGQKILDIGETALDSTQSIVGSLSWVVPTILVLGALVFVYVYSKKVA